MIKHSFSCFKYYIIQSPSQRRTRRDEGTNSGARYYLWGEGTNSARLRTPGEKSKQFEKFIDERGRVTIVHVCMGGQLTDLKNMANYQQGAKITYRGNWSDYILVP